MRSGRLSRRRRRRGEFVGSDVCSVMVFVGRQF